MAEEPKADAVSNLGQPEPDVQSLEKKYIELLEKRIADLEDKLKDSEKVNHVETDSAARHTDIFRTRRRKQKKK